VRFWCILLLFFAQNTSALVVDQELMPYVRRFVQEARSYGCEISPVVQVVGFGPDVMIQTLGKDAIAFCALHDDGNRSIWVSHYYWGKLSFFQRRMLLYHELGHCMLSMDHVDLMLDDECPLSVMHPYIADDDCTDLESYYHQELFEVACPKPKPPATQHGTGVVPLAPNPVQLIERLAGMLWQQLVSWYQTLF
jgi:hypothetical protein